MLMPGVPLRYIMSQEIDRTKYPRWRAKPTGPTSTYVPLHAVLIPDARQFITAKQHENISLHSLVQGISINDITWLAIPGSPRPNPQEAAKRRKLVEDLITWIFEGYLIPLLRVRLTFYATETAATRYKIVYYPHEAWSAATKPHFDHLQQNFLQDLDHVSPRFHCHGMS
jgi:hypothetical protein